MSIIGSLPVTLTNNTLADATQVMTDLNFIISQVNAYAAALAGGNAFTGTQTINGSQVATYTDLANYAPFITGVVWLDSYGADPTGVADSTSAWNAAKVAAGEKTVVVGTPGATYLFNSAITIGNSGAAATFYCSGYCTFKFSGIGSTTDCFTLVGSAYRRQTITGLIINANATGRDAVVLSNGDHPIFQRCIIQNSYRDAFVIYCIGAFWVENGHFELELDTCGRNAIRLQIDGTGGAFINECTWADVEIRGVSAITAGGRAVYITGTATTAGASLIGHLWLKTNFDCQYPGTGPVPSLNVVENDSVIVSNWRFMAGDWENTLAGTVTGGYSWAVTGSGVWGGLTIDSSIDNSGWGNLGANAGILKLTFFDFSQGLNKFDSPVLVGTRTYNSAGAGIQTSNGVTFPATQVASNDANTMDDYEEGTWTPVLTNGTTTATSYFWQRGYYQKIGNQVYFEVQMSVNSYGIGSGTLKITGLPFSLVSDPSLGTQTTSTFIGLINSVSVGPLLAQIVQTAPTTIALAMASTPPTPLPFGAVAAAGQILVQGFYRSVM